MSSGSLQSEARQGMYSLYSQEKGLVEIKRLAGQNSTKKRPIRLYSRDSSSILDKSSIFFSVLIYFDEYNCTIFFGTEIDEYIFN
jgi:hypothetical protein